MSKPLSICLVLPYKNNPKKSFRLASHQMLQLRRLSFYPFSQVNHTHNYHLEIRDHYCPKCFERSLDCWSPDHELYCSKCSVEFSESKLITDNYYEWNLHFLKGFMNHDYNTYDRPSYEKDKHRKEFDSGVIMFMSEIAYEVKYECKICKTYLEFTPEGNSMWCPLCKRYDYEWNESKSWKSFECEKEFKFAIENYILVLKTEMFIQIAQKYVKLCIEYKEWDLINYIIKEYPEVVL
jgi:hypothetical protein